MPWLIESIKSFFSQPQIDKLSYFPQIDGLRAFAVIAVFIAHFLRPRHIHWGRLGVVHFFVISGVLITLILLNNRLDSEEKAVSKKTVLTAFYVRRFIRIVPIYYLTIAILFWAGYKPVEQHLGSLLTYTVNISQAFFEVKYKGTAHFWSLGVEEQFYLFFPFIILFIKKRYIPYFLIGSIISSITYKYIGSVNGFTWEAISRFPLGNLDSLGLGALYAYYLIFYNQHKRAFNALLGICFLGIILLIGTQLYTISYSKKIAEANIYYRTLIDFSIAMTSIIVIHMAIRNSNWLPGYILRLAPIRYIGKISYGAYIYHNLVRLIPLNSALPIEKFLVWTVLSLGLASLSWQIFEAPINSLKRYFPYLGKNETVHQELRGHQN